jgi:hypothetical protein
MVIALIEIGPLAMDARWHRHKWLCCGAVGHLPRGQSTPPSIGGRFDLLNPAGIAVYRITIPTTELKTRVPL